MNEEFESLSFDSSDFYADDEAKELYESPINKF